jgi:hypothetical protein
MIALLIAQVRERTGRYLAGFLFEAARFGLFASVRAFRRGLLNERLLHEALHLTSNVRRYACHLALDRPFLRRRS